MYHDVSDDVVLLIAIVTCDTFEITELLNDSQDLWRQSEALSTTRIIELQIFRFHGKGV